MSSSRANARTWPYPHHRDFEQRLRRAASAWFENHGFAVSDRYSYILADWVQWPSNIILPQVAAYMEKERGRRQDHQRGFPLHKYLHHGLSSQAMLFNLVGPLIVEEDVSPLQQALAQQGVALPEGTLHVSLEYQDREAFNEDTGQPTSLDLVLEGKSRCAPVLLEAKLAETEFGGCSIFAAGDCDGRNPAHDFSLCYLHHSGRSYWELLDRHDFLSGPIGSDAACILASHYQFFREALFALKLGGVLVLVSDARSPTFHCDGRRGERGLMPFLLSLLPPSARASIASVTIQQVVAAIKASGRHQWIHEFERKYGLS